MNAKVKKIKTFVITVSKTFPATHKRKGEPTEFPINIIHAVTPAPFLESVDKKIHTIRANYDFWKKRIEQVQKGEAILSIRYWSGKPYNSKQVEICHLSKDDGVGVQELDFAYGNDSCDHDEEYETLNLPFIGDKNLDIKAIAKNDGLSFDDFENWFKGYDLTEPMAIIHLTKFRY